MKNRHSALRPKTSPAQTTSRPKNNPKPKLRSGRPSRKQSSNQLDFSDSAFPISDGVDVEHQTDEDDDDDDEDDDDDDDDDEVSDAEKFLNMEWQQDASVNTGTTQRRAAAAYTTNQSLPRSLPAHSDIQQSFNPSSATVEQWNHQVQDPAMYPGPFPFTFGQNGYSDNNSHTSVLPGMSPTCTNSSLSLQPYQSAYRSSVAQATIPIHSPTSDQTLNVPGYGIPSTLEKEQIGPLAKKSKSSPPSRISSTSGSVAQKGQGPREYQGLMEHEPRQPGEPLSSCKAHELGSSSS